MKLVFTESQLDVLAHKVRKLLKGTGFLIHHSGLSETLCGKGLKQSSSGRFVFDDVIIDEFISHQSRRRSSIKKVNASPPSPAGPFKMSFGNLAPKYYDYPTQMPQSAKTSHLIDVVRFAHQEDKIEFIVLPLVVTDVPELTAPIESFLIVVKLTDKYRYSIDPFSAPLVKYLVELSRVFLGEGKANQFIDPCDCINPGLCLEDRTAGVMLERAKYHLNTLMTSMPTAGGTAPVTLDGAILQGAAEIVGGLIIAYLLNPDVNLRGYISSSVMDLRTANTTQSSPETVLIDCGVVQLMDYAFGGNTQIGGRSFIAARRPGLMAVYERLFKASAYHQFTGNFHFAGNGVLNNGCLLSPEQLLIDMDIAESFHRLQPVDVRDDSVENVIAEVAEHRASDFLFADHTLENFRGVFWEPTLFSRGETLSEQKVLDNAHQRFRDGVKRYQGYAYDPAKVKAAEEILACAKKELSCLSEIPS